VEHNNRYRFIIISTLILVRCCVGLIWASAGPLLPLIMQAVGLSRGSVGWFASAAPITIVLVSLPLSIIYSRYSMKWMFAVGAFLQAGGLFAPFATNYLLIILTRVCFAAGTAITVPVATAIAAEWFTSRNLPLVNGITMSFVTLGNAIAFIATVPIATVLSWRAPITIYGAFALTCAISWAVLGRDRQKVPRRTGVAVVPVLEERPDLSFKQVITNRSTILLTLSVMSSWALGNAIGSWLPNYYHEVFKMPLEKASSILAVATVGGALACITGGILPMRLGRRKPFLIVSGIFTGLSALFAVLFNNPFIIYLSVAFFGIFGNLQSPSLFTIPMELPDMSLRSGMIVVSVMQMGGNLGNFISPLIVGYLADITGSYLPGFITFSIISLSVIVAGILLPETGPKATKVLEKGSVQMQIAD
jgi:MFS family permease